MATTYANMRNFSHKGSGDKSISGPPDVCKTPIGNSTPPIPYPVLSQVGDLGGGTSSVKLEGNPTAIKSSNHKSCTGDQPGTAKGIGSGSVSKKTEFTTYSFDVKAEGEGVVRGFDMSTMNNKNTMGTVLGSMTGPAIVVDEVIEEWEPEETPPWIKIRASYDDLWNTPYGAENVKVTVNDAVVAEDVTLNEGIGDNTHSYSLDEAKATKDEPGVLVVEPEEDGKVVVTIEAKPNIEKDIQDAKDGIVELLDGAYASTVEDMKGFTEIWDEYGWLSIALSFDNGQKEGAEAWLEDQASLFDKDTWVALGDKVGELTSSTLDYAADYASDTYDNVVERANDLSEWAEDNEENLSNWNWWSTQLEELASDASDEILAVRDSVEEQINDAVEYIGETKETLEKVYKYRNEIMKLPEYIASGDARKVQWFVDNILVNIDAELAQEIKENPNFGIALELIAEHDAALVYMAYSQLFLEAVPPNFYAFVVGKGSSYLALEVVMFIALAFLSAGTGAAARLAAIAGRLASGGAKAAGAAKKIKNAQKALDAFVKTLEDFSKAGDKLMDLGKLLKGRAGTGNIVRTKNTVAMKKKQVKRDRRCRICHKDDHRTPRKVKDGVIEYE
ncbi:MAG: hypothetical protein ACI9Y1_003328 [Lentisphaeria bacterium]|jgi:hypothetical protein